CGPRRPQSPLCRVCQRAAGNSHAAADVGLRSAGSVGHTLSAAANGAGPGWLAGCSTRRPPVPRLSGVPLCSGRPAARLLRGPKTERTSLFVRPRLAGGSGGSARPSGGISIPQEREKRRKRFPHKARSLFTIEFPFLSSASGFSCGEVNQETTFFPFGSAL